MAVTLRVLGSGDPFGTDGRNASGYLVESGPLRMLLDCGPATVASLKRWKVDTATVCLVLLTHYHGDHLAGLPFLFHDYQYCTRRRRLLTVAGPPGLRTRVDRVYDALYPGVLRRPRRYRVRYQVLSAGRWFRPQGLTGFRLLPFRVRHEAGRPNFGYILEASGRRLVYTGDTEWFDSLPRFTRGADLFLCECTTRRPDTPGHLSLEVLQANRSRLGARRTLLTHLGPEVVRRGRIPGFRLARDGMVVRV